MRKLFLLLLVIGVTTAQLDAQFLRNLRQKVQNDVIDKVSDKIADKIAEDIANRAYKPIDKAFEDEYKEQYRDSTGQESADPEAFSKFLAGFNSAAEKLPESYTFDIINHVEIEDDKGDINSMKILFPSKGDYFAIETEEDGKQAYLVYDLELEIFAMYTTEDNKSRVTVMPSMFDLAASMVKSSNDLGEDFTIEETGNTKTICGYLCHEYKSKSKDYTTFSFVSKDFPISWNDSYGKFVEKFAPAASSDFEDLQGMALYSESTSNEEQPKTTIMEVIKVDNSEVVIDSKNYEKVQMGQ